MVSSDTVIQDNNKTGTDRRGPRERSFRLVLISLIVALTLLDLLSVAYHYRNHVFDDSFITYRYAENLSSGYGITWNTGEAPTEGYTSLLHVLLMALAITADMDPLWTTRILSYICIAAITAGIYGLARRLFKEGRIHAFLVAIAFPALSHSEAAAMLGLETLIFTFLSYMSFHFAVLFFIDKRRRDLRLSFILQVLALLARPEQALLSACILAGLFFYSRSETTVPLRPVIRDFTVLFILPLAAYLVWKWYYFGSLLPNSFYIKSTSGALLGPGFKDMLTFFSNLWGTILLALFSFLPAVRVEERWHRRVALLYISGFLLFYMQANTLMESEMRFFIPLTPFIYCLALPVISSSVGWAGGIAGRSLPRAAAVCVLVLLAVFNNPLEISRHVRSSVRGDSMFIYHMTVEREIGKILNLYPHIKNILIAFGDAGALPYYSKAKSLDIVGLNDSFISREKDLSMLVNYLFSRNPDLIIIPVEPATHLPITSGHGVLGDYMAWSDSPQWKGYTYVGITGAGLYDLMFMVNASSVYADSLMIFLRSSLISDKPKIPLKFWKS